MKLSKLFSTRELRRQFIIAGRRLPFSIAFLCVATALFIINIIDDQAIVKQPGAIIWGGVLGVLSTLTVYLWCELLGSRRLLKPLLLLASAVTIADVWHILYRGDFGSNAESLARGALFTALTVAILFPPFAKGGNRRIMFRFTVEHLRAILMTVALSLVLSIASGIILGTIEILFCKLSYELWVCWFTVASFFIPGLFYMTRVPRIVHLRRSPDADPIGVGNATVYVLLPLVAIYMAILYVYGVLIVVKWELPTDSLSSMVSGLLCASMVALYGLQAFNLYDKVDRRVAIAAFTARWLPVLLIPLLVLMTVGLCYRINQYGVTISRLYVATFALWAYVVVIYLSVKGRGANLNRVAASFAAVFALVTIFPYANYSTLTLNYMERMVKKSLGDMHYPVTEAELKERIAQMPKAEAKQTAAWLDYLSRYSPDNNLKSVMSGHTYVREYDLLADTDYSDHFSFYLSGPAPVAQGYSKVEYRYIYPRQSQTISGRIIKIESDKDEIFINIDTLRTRIDAGYTAPLSVSAVTPSDSAATFVMTTVRGNFTDDGVVLSDIRGYLYQN